VRDIRRDAMKGMKELVDSGVRRSPTRGARCRRACAEAHRRPHEADRRPPEAETRKRSHVLASDVASAYRRQPSDARSVRGLRAVAIIMDGTAAGRSLASRSRPTDTVRGSSGSPSDRRDSLSTSASSRSPCMAFATMNWSGPVEEVEALMTSRRELSPVSCSDRREGGMCVRVSWLVRDPRALLAAGQE